MKDRVEIVASGFGGQGVVRLGQIIGEAAVKQGLHVTMLKSHGTEMRGGYVRSQVVFFKRNYRQPHVRKSGLFRGAVFRGIQSIQGHGAGYGPDHLRPGICREN